MIIMNKYIKTDIEQGLKYLRTGIMNALADIESGNEKEIILGEFVPFSLVVECAKERGWTESYCDYEDMTNGFEHDCWYYMNPPNSKIEVCIESCLWKGQITKIYIDENN